MKQPDDALRIDHDVTAKLPDILALFPGKAAAENVAQIPHDPQRARQTPQIAFLHGVGVIQFELRI